VAWTRVATVQVARSKSGCPYALRVEIINLSVRPMQIFENADSLCREARGKYTVFIFNSFYISSPSKISVWIILFKSDKDQDMNSI